MKITRSNNVLIRAQAPESICRLEKDIIMTNNAVNTTDQGSSEVYLDNHNDDLLYPCMGDDNLKGDRELVTEVRLDANDEDKVVNTGKGLKAKIR